MGEYTSVSCNFAPMVYPSTGIYTAGSPSGSAMSSPLLPTLYCAFCSKPGHAEPACALYIAGQSAARAQSKKHRRRRKAKKTAAASATQVEESAGNAAISPSPLPISDLWNADTGASSHMTPNRHWFKTYTPYVTPVRLANGQLVYSAGIGSVQFEPTINEGAARPFTAIQSPSCPLSHLQERLESCHQV